MVKNLPRAAWDATFEEDQRRPSYFKTRKFLGFCITSDLLCFKDLGSIEHLHYLLLTTILILQI